MSYKWNRDLGALSLTDNAGLVECIRLKGTYELGVFRNHLLKYAESKIRYVERDMYKNISHTLERIMESAIRSSSAAFTLSNRRLVVIWDNTDSFRMDICTESDVDGEFHRLSYEYKFPLKELYDYLCKEIEADCFHYGFDATNVVSVDTEKSMLILLGTDSKYHRIPLHESKNIDNFVGLLHWNVRNGTCGLKPNILELVSERGLKKFASGKDVILATAYKEDELIVLKDVKNCINVSIINFRGTSFGVYDDFNISMSPSTLHKEILLLLQAIKEEDDDVESEETVPTVNTQTNEVKFKGVFGEDVVIKFPDEKTIKRVINLARRYVSTGELTVDEDMPSNLVDGILARINSASVVSCYGEDGAIVLSQNGGVVNIRIWEALYIPSYSDYSYAGSLDSFSSMFEFPPQLSYANSVIPKNSEAINMLIAAANAAANVENNAEYSEYVKKYVRQRLGLDKDDSSKDEYINSMSKFEVFESALEWEGIQGYAYMIKSLIEDIYGIDLDTIGTN